MSPATTPDPPPILDSQALDRLRALDPGGANKLLDRALAAFGASLDQMLPKLSAGRQSGDAASVKLVAHTLRSSAAQMGALHLAQLCTQAETSLREGAPLGTLDALIDRLLSEGRRVREGLSAVTGRAP